MNTQPTPGPWRIGDAGHTVFGPPNKKPSPEIVAVLNGGNFRDNGRLIAAAPELLEACWLAVAAIDCIGAVGETPPHYQEMADAKCLKAYQAMLAAIAKAEGKR